MEFYRLKTNTAEIPVHQRSIQTRHHKYFFSTFSFSVAQSLHSIDLRNRRYLCSGEKRFFPWPKTLLQNHKRAADLRRNDMQSEECFMITFLINQMPNSPMLVFTTDYDFFFSSNEKKYLLFSIQQNIPGARKEIFLFKVIFILFLAVSKTRYDGVKIHALQLTYLSCCFRQIFL